MLAVVVGTLAGSVSVVFLVALVWDPIGDVIGILHGPKIEVQQFPPECLSHMGDWVHDEKNGGRAIVWLGDEAELIACVSAMNPDIDRDPESPDWWRNYADIRLPGDLWIGVTPEPLSEVRDMPPPTLIGFDVHDACFPYYEANATFDESNSEWVFTFTGSYEDWRECLDAVISEARRDPGATFVTFKYRGALIDSGFVFVTATPMP